MAAFTIAFAGFGSTWAGGELAWDLRGEVALVSGIDRIDGEVLPAATTARSLTLLLRLDGSLDLASSVALRAVVAPGVVLGRPGDPQDAPTTSLGVEDLYLRLGATSGAYEASFGVRRWPVGELRLQPALRLDSVDEFGTPRGLLGAQLVTYLHPWRLRVGVTSPIDAELHPLVFGAAAAARWDVARWTLEAHGFSRERSGGGVTASGTVGDQVVYGDLWLLATPWEARGGAGISGYVGDVLVTAEAGWVPPTGALDETPRPSLRVSVAAAPIRDLALDASAGAAWPDDPRTPGERTTVIDARVSLTFATGDADLTLTPSLRHGGGSTVLGTSLALRSYF